MARGGIPPDSPLRLGGGTISWVFSSLKVLVRSWNCGNGRTPSPYSFPHRGLRRLDLGAVGASVLTACGASIASTTISWFHYGELEDTWLHDHNSFFPTKTYLKLRQYWHKCAWWLNKYWLPVLWLWTVLCQIFYAHLSFSFFRFLFILLSANFLFNWLCVRYRLTCPFAIAL